jgi:hypothetical protein
LTSSCCAALSEGTASCSKPLISSMSWCRRSQVWSPTQPPSSSWSPKWLCVADPHQRRMRGRGYCHVHSHSIVDTENSYLSFFSEQGVADGTARVFDSTNKDVSLFILVETS